MTLAEICARWSAAVEQRLHLVHVRHHYEANKMLTPALLLQISLANSSVETQVWLMENATRLFPAANDPTAAGA